MRWYIKVRGGLRARWKLWGLIEWGLKRWWLGWRWWGLLWLGYVYQTASGEIRYMGQMLEKFEFFSLQRRSRSGPDIFIGNGIKRKKGVTC